ncbi:nephrocystin-4, partial [Elysia marginata]
MAAILTGKSWRDFLDKNTHLPAAFDREHAAHDISTPVCLNVKSFQVPPYHEDDANVKYQVSMCLYDTTYKQFFGRQWKGPFLPPTRGNRLQYNKSVYFHTSAGTSSVVLVFEVQAETVGRDGRPRRESCGWGLIRPFGYEASDMPDSSRGIQPATQRIHMYHGSPRALYYLEEPIDANQYLKTVEGCTLTCAVMSHKALRRIMTLLPENTLVDSNDIIPGMVDGTEGLVIQLQPNVDKFEDKLCELMRIDRALRENRTEDTTDVIIVERRLQVGVHNGWCYLEKPVVFHLDKQSGRGTELGKKPTASPSLRRSSMYHIRRNSLGSSSGGDSSNVVLTLKNRIQIDELLEDPMCAIVFTLEYIMGEPLSAQDRKTSMSMTRAHTRTMTVRWGSWTPLLHPNTSEVTLALVGGPQRSPDDALMYKLPATSMQHESTAMSAGGLIAFRWARNGESIQPTMPSSLMVPPYNQIGSAGSLRSEVSDGMLVESNTSGDMLRLKPPMGKLSPRSPRTQASRGYHATHHPSQSAAATVPGYAYQQQAAAGVPPMGGVPGQMAGTVPYMAAQQYAQPMMGQMNMVTAPPQQFMPMSSMYPGMYAPPSGLMPIDVMHVQETAASSELKDLPYTPVHALVLAQGPGTKGGRGLSRSAYARLYSAGFSPLRDRNGEPPEVIDPHSQHLINVAREQVDPLQANEVIFQFLAYSKEPASGGNGFVENQAQASTVYFTFQFYRFPQVTTE